MHGAAASVSAAAILNAAPTDADVGESSGEAGDEEE